MRLGLGTDISVGYRQPLFGGVPFLLDTYTGAAAAYSLRQLSSSTTDVVRVRRSSDNAESDFTAAEITDGTLTTWTGANDGFVVTWYDQVASNDMTESTAAYQNKIVSSGLLQTENGKPIATGVINGGYLSAYAPKTGSYPMTLLVVGKAANTGTSCIICSELGGGDYGYYMASGSTSILVNNLLSVSDEYKNGSSLSYTNRGDAYTEFASQFLLFANCDFTLWVDNKLGIGYRRANPASTYSISLQELILFTNDQLSNRTAIESDINSHYSIY